MQASAAVRRLRQSWVAPLPAAARPVLLAAFAVLVALRMPGILVRGRFWAEEGGTFLVFAWKMPWWRALLAPFGGYLNITANLAGILAWHVAPLGDAPYASSLLALAVQLCPAILLVTSRIEWLNQPYALVTALLAVLLVPVSEEVWISSIGSQVHLSLCVALILALETRGGRAGAFRLFLLLLAALSGPGSWLLTVLFAARAVVDRSRPRAMQMIVLGTGVLIQLVFFYSHLPGRAYAFHPVLFLDLAFQKHVLLPLIGPERLLASADAEMMSVSAGTVPWHDAAAMVVVVAATLLAMWRDRHSVSFWLLCAATLMIGVSYVGVLGPFAYMFSAGGPGRYTYAPQAAIALAVLGCAVTRRGPVGIVATMAAAWLLAVGGIYYFIPSSWIFAKGPSWRTELAAHRRDPAHIVESWPPGWHVPLPDDAAPHR